MSATLWFLILLIKLVLESYSKPVHSNNYKTASGVDAEETRAEVGKIGLIINSFVSQLNRHVVFALYSTEFQEIPYRGRVRFCLVFDLMRNIIAFQKGC